MVQYLQGSADPAILPKYSGKEPVWVRYNYMKSTGIVRPIDSLGRIVLPKEIRNTLNINPKDSLEIFIESDRIILKKYAPSCIFCENVESVAFYKGKLICGACMEALKNISAE